MATGASSTWLPECTDKVRRLKSETHVDANQGSYHDAVQELSYRFVHLVEEAFDIPIGTFDHFFGIASSRKGKSWMPPQHRIKLVKYPPSSSADRGQGVGAHKDSSGWLTFLYQVGNQECLEVMNAAGDWILAPPIENSFVVNFGNAMEAATEGAVKATVHRVTVILVQLIHVCSRLTLKGSQLHV